jgi:hypothetical protein
LIFFGMGLAILINEIIKAINWLLDRIALRHK